MKLPLTQLERNIFQATCSFQNGELQFSALLPSLLSKTTPRNETFDSKKYLTTDQLPQQVRKYFDDEALREIHRELQTQTFVEQFSKPTFEDFFTRRMSEVFQYNEGRSYQHYYADYDIFSVDDIESKGTVQAILVVVMNFYRDKGYLKFMYNHLLENYYYVDIPLTSLESFRKYVSRKEEVGLPKGLIHGLIGEPSNNRELSGLMKAVLIQLAIQTPTNKYPKLVKEDLDYLIETLPSVKDNGVYSVSVEKIAAFLATPEADGLISLAKDDPTEFRRKITGILRFVRASAPLVKIYVDGYSFQVDYKNLETNEPDRFTGLFIYDDYSDYAISWAIGDSENYDLLMDAFKNYFKRTGNALPREIVMDKYTYKLFKKNRRLLELFKRNGVAVYRSSNANRKSRLERFFLTLQQRILSRLINFAGPGVKAKGKRAHPFRSFRLLLANQLANKYDLYHLLNRLIKTTYNKFYRYDTVMYSPEERFEKNPNPIKKIDDSLVTPLFDELHQVTFRGASVVLKRGPNYHLYYKRDYEFISKYNGVGVDVYVDPNNLSSAKLYERDMNNFMVELPEFKMISCAMFDRTELDQERVNQFTKVTRELIELHEQELKSMAETVRQVLGGRELKDVTIMAKIKKEESSEEKARNEMNLDVRKKETEMFHSNNSRRKRRGKRSEAESYGINIVSTF